MDSRFSPRLVVVVSPHRDDAAFSCSIAIRQLARTCKVVVANFFTVSEYAPFRTDEPGSVSEIRLSEDREFAKCAGVSLQDLDLLDAPERLSIGVSQISDGRAIDESEHAVLSVVSSSIAGFHPDLVFAPLALGDHFDHRISRAASIKAGIEALAFYEDLPYAARLPEGAASARAAELNLKLSPYTFSAPDGESWKRQCASFYRSQVEETTVREIAAYSARYVSGERCWLTPSAVEILRARQ